MAKKIVLVGHCGPDSSFLRIAASRAGRDVSVLSADDDRELMTAIESGVDLLLVNRQLDYGFDTHEGVELIRKLKPFYGNLRMMLVSNYPEAQEAAVKAGALPGFGKRDVGTPRVTELLRAAIQSDEPIGKP